VTGFTDGARVGLVGRKLPPAFELRVRVLPVGCAEPVDTADWDDSLVEVARGEIELEFVDGKRPRFRDGDVLWLDGLPVRFMRNCGPVSAVLVAIRRRSR
jgi:hypothetical protein